MPFPDSSFDLVVAIEVFEHFADPDRALAELVRVGTDELIASVPLEPIWRVGNMVRGRYLGDLGNTPGHVNHWSRRGFSRFVAQRWDVTEVACPLPWTMVRARCEMSTVTRRSLAGVVGLAVGIAGLAFVGIRIARDWDQIVETMRSANPAWLFAAVVAGLVSMTLIAVNWLSLIERRGHATSLSAGLSWFFVGQLGKYVPGGIWPVVGQAELASRAGPDRRSTYLATASSMTTMLLGAVTVAAVSGLASPYDRWVTAALIGLGLAVGFGSLGLPQVRTGLGRLASAISRRPVELPDVRGRRRVHPPARSGVGDVRSDEHLRGHRAGGIDRRRPGCRSGVRVGAVVGRRIRHHRGAGRPRRARDRVRRPDDRAARSDTGAVGRRHEPSGHDRRRPHGGDRRGDAQSLHPIGGANVGTITDRCHDR